MCDHNINTILLIRSATFTLSTLAISCIGMAISHNSLYLSARDCIVKLISENNVETHVATCKLVLEAMHVQTDSKRF